MKLRYCDAPISESPVDNPSTRGIYILGRFAPKSWYWTDINYPWTSSYLTPLPYVPSSGPIHSYLNLKYEKKMNNYSLRGPIMTLYHNYILDYLYNSPKEFL